MNELSDFEFDKTEEKDEYATGEFERDDELDGTGPGGPKRLWPILLIVVVIVAGIVYWLNRSEPAEESEPAPPPVEKAEPTPQPRPEPASEPIVLPELDASDELVASLVQELSSNPRFASMLVSENLVRRFAAAIANIAEGQSPRAHLDALEPTEPFSVRRVDERLVPSANSYERYDLVSEVIASLDTEGTVELYRQLEPLIDEAFAELGYPGRDFDDVLVDALDHLIATPDVGSDVELVERVTVYHFSDPELEDLSAAQKQLLRAGPENARKIQAALRSLRAELTK